MMASFTGEENSTPQISGIVNDYAKVTQVGFNTLTLDDASAFNVGDKVLIIQMKGATISTEDDIDYGNVLSWGNAGDYEFGEVVSRDGNELTFLHKVCKSYDPTHAVQAVRVPVYNKVDVVGTLTAAPWDGEKGGIVAIWATGKVRLYADIDVEGLGFRGGAFNGRAVKGGSTYSCTIESGKGGRKGEGIVEIPNTGCRGKQATGGGGGNDHNGGGGGGGNYGNGGVGGHGWLSNRTGRLSDLNKGGLGGLSLSAHYNDGLTKLFLGGGGGGGHQNNGASFPGGDGGGIAILVGKKLVLKEEVTINAAGADAQDIRINDGASGGGAGGTILLDFYEFKDVQRLTLRIDGGDGADVLTRDQHGPGGGGGGGIVNSPRTLPSEMTVERDGGNPGLFISSKKNSSNPHHNTHHGATAGTAGAVLDNLIIQLCTSQPELDLNGVHPGTGLMISYDNQGRPSDIQDSTLLDIQDNDNVYLAKAEISLMNPSDGISEYLTLSLDSSQLSLMSIDAEYDSLHHKVTLTGSSLVENYQRTISSIQYVHDDPNPTPADRFIEVGVNDGGSDSNPAYTTVILTSNSFLPVEWLHFDAISREGAADLTWATATEENTDYYSVERSTDGRIFTALGIVPAAGNSQTQIDYDFTDEDLEKLNQSKIFYRLRQVDLNGHSSFSQVVEFQLEGDQSLFDFKLNTLANGNAFEIQPVTGAGNGSVVTVLNLEGKLLFQKPFPANERKMRVEIQNWRPGIYVVTMNKDLEVVSKKMQIE